MRCEQKFYICKKCGNVVGAVLSSGVPMMCCGEKMEELVPNTVDAAKEKHVPVVTVDGSRVDVQVGSVDHPMLDEHYIEWIYIETEQGGQRKCLSPGEKPAASFLLQDDKARAAFAYCNLHGLWKTAL